MLNIFANMGRAANSKLTQAIHAIGWNTRDFCVERLGIGYSTFNYRVRAGVLPLEAMHTILRETGKKFEDLWPDPAAPARASESETIPRLALPIVRPVAVAMIERVQQRTHGTIESDDPDDHEAARASLIKPKKALPLTPNEAKKGEEPVKESSPAPSTFKASGLFSEISLPEEPEQI